MYKKDTTEMHLPDNPIRPLPTRTAQIQFSSNQANSTREIDLVEYLKIFDRFRWLILLSCAVFSICSIIYCFTTTPLYSARAKIQIGSYQPLLGTGQVENVLSEASRDDYYLDTQINEITSLSVADNTLKNPKILESVQKQLQNSSIFSFLSFNDNPVTEHDSSNKYKHPINLIEGLLKKINVTPVKKTSLVEVIATDKDKKIAAMLANDISEAYIEWVRNTRVSRQSQGLDFLSREQVQIKNKVSNLERELAAYAEENSIVAVNNEENVIVQKMSQLNKLLLEATGRRIEAEKIFEEAEKAGAEGLSSIPDSALQTMATELSTLEARKSELLNKYTAKYPKVQQIHAQIEGLKISMSQRGREIIQGLKVKATAAKEEENNIKEEFEQQESKVFELSRKEVQYNVIKRELDSARELLANVTRQIAETGLLVQSNSSNVSLVDYAVVPTKPSHPKKLLIISIAGILGLVVGGILAITLHSLDNTLHTPEELENLLQIPNLGVVPSFEKDSKKANVAIEAIERTSENSNKTADIDKTDNETTNENNIRTEQPNLQIVNGLSNLIEIEYFNRPTSLASEAYRTIRTGVLLSQAGEPPRTILVTSAQSSEGKTTASANLAASLASTGANVIVVDCDLRRPSVSKVFQATKNSLGLSEVLTGQAVLSDVITKKMDNISLISSGRIPPNPAELLGSSHMANLLDQLSVSFDYVILDSPPVLPVTDSIILSKIVDGVVFIVKADSTPRKVTLDAMVRLSNVGARILGTILNDIDVSRRTYGYYNKYYFAYYSENRETA